MLGHFENMADLFGFCVVSMLSWVFEFVALEFYFLG